MQKVVRKNLNNSKIYMLDKSKLTQNLHTLKTAAVSIAIQDFYKLALLSGNSSY